MNKKQLLVIKLSFILLLTLTHPAQSKSCSTIEVCFTPGENCTAKITNLINQAKKSVWIQAYSFTSAPIAKAVVEAKSRGVDVRVILDKSQLTQKYSAATFLFNHAIPTWIDTKPAIAHNKIIIIDDTKVITGSFNFTNAANERNAENLVMISDFTVTSRYTAYWIKRMRLSTPLITYSSKIENIIKIKKLM